MPSYSYVAKSISGEEKTGSAEAKDLHQLARALREQGFILVHAVSEKEKTAGRKISFSIPFLGSVPLEEKMMFTRNLQVMVASGLSLPKALAVLSLQTKSNKFKKAIDSIKNEVVEGKNFSDSLADHSEIFSELFQNMIRVGEEAGNLEEVLTVLARQMEKEHELKSKIQSALMYPAVIISAMIGIGVLMLIMVVPKLAETFAELEIELPFTTQLVINVGVFLATKWYFGLALIIAMGIIFLLISKSMAGKKLIDGFVLRIPIASVLIKKSNSASTIRTLSSLVAAGVPLVRSLEIISNTLGNVYYKKAIIEASEKVKKGGRLSEALEPYGNLYPIVVFQMIKVGEETGETAKILSKLAEFFEEEVGTAARNLTSIIEPVLMLVIGVVIGFFAISMVQPMYSMLDSV
ncbi:MAG: type II secretion system F family protein [Candidatus Pacebacteria bacterium]|nr:type II secretion system F family protein [Candidatus Paceibacterota bacterium]